MRRGLAAAVMVVAWLGCSSDETTSNSGTTSSAVTAGSGGAGGASSSSTGSATGGGAGVGGMGGAPVRNNGFPEHWNDGTSCGSEPNLQVWAYADDTYILRQSLCTNFEGPFIYLLLGESGALVQDTGTGAVNLYQPIAQLVSDYASARGLGTLPVYVTHSHGHGDHVGGDGQFSGQPDVTVVGSSQNAVANFFAINSWPDEQTTFDLGGRVLDVLAIPGHQSAHVALYDRRHQLLLTGDTLYPGRLYINNWSQYRASIQRLVDFAEAGSAVSWVLGTHIEMKAAGGDFPFGAQQHPGEHELQLPYATLVELNDAVQAMGNNPTLEEHADFIIYP